MHLNSAIVIYSTKKEAKASLFGNPLGARTQDPHIKSVMLYQLS